MPRISVDIDSLAPPRRSPTVFRPETTRPPNGLVTTAEAYQLTLFDSELSPEALPMAIEELEGALNSTTANGMLSQALDSTYALEFIISALGPSSSSFLLDWMHRNFPAQVADYSSTAVTTRCIARLATYLSSEDMEAYVDVDVTSVCSWIRRSVDTLDALKAMVSSDAYFTNATRQDNLARNRQRARTLPSSEPLDVRPFLDVNIPAPRSLEDATAAGASILVKQRAVLKELFQTLQEVSIQERLREDYLFYGPNSGSLSAYSSPSLGNPALETLCADLSYEIPEGFGPWLIVTTDRARKDLAIRRRKGKVLYESALDALRELSYGCFTVNKMKPISNDSPVHILEARLPDNPRLVYQVHVVRDTGDGVVKQAILVYGIYTHQDIKRINWDKYARQQARRGKAYVEACRKRPEGWRMGQAVSQPHTLEDYAGTLDMVHSIEDDEPADSGHSGDLTEKEVDDMHNQLVLGQHSVLNQNLLDGLDKKQLLAQLYHLSDDELEVVHYTQSCLVLGRSGTGKTTTVFFKIAGIERAWAQLPDGQMPRPRQVFVTRSPHLVHHVENEFVAFARSEAVASNAPPHLVSRANQIREQKRERHFEDGAWRADLPRRFSELQDEHFPLFVTFDDLCTMVEQDFVAQDKARQARVRRVGGLVDAYRSADASIVTFDLFKTHYWPRMPANLVRDQDPAVAFGQFIGHIEGCEDTLRSEGSPLGRDAYERSRVQSVDYSLYEAYVKLKKKRCERDVAHRAHSILNALKNRRFPGKRIDYLYIDEVQDNNLAEVALLRYFCRNTRGMLWAGDTAQTIAHGSDFRFADLRAFLFRQEQLDSGRIAVWEEPEPARFFHLSINYRSPGGVVECAHSIVALLSRFPRSIDELKREEGIIPGLKPQVIGLADKGEIKRFFCVKADGSCTIGPGANQRILVRNKRALGQLQGMVGDIATTTAMTIYQSKGLEADDVILFRLWTALFTHLNTYSGQIDGVDRRFSALILELKNLYVAITRTKRRLWIVDDPEYSGPMFSYWAQHNLTTEADATVTVEQFIDHSKDHEWKSTAFRFFKQGLYEQAANAYERAGDPRTARLARAMGMYQSAFEVPVSRKRQRREEIEKSARALLLSAEEIDDADDRKGAAGKAAECFIELGDQRRAAEAYELGRDWSKAARLFMKAHMMDRAVKIVQDNEDDLDDGVKRAVYDVAKSSYLAKLEVKKAAKLFDDEKKFDEFLITHEFDTARAMELERRHRSSEAAQIYFAEGRILKALELLVADGGNVENVALAFDLGAAHLYSSNSIGSACNNHDDTLDGEVMALLEQLQPPSDTTMEDMSIFRAITHSDHVTLMRIASQANPRSPRDRARILACLNHCFPHDDMSLLHTKTQENEVLDVLASFRLYVTTLHQVILGADSVIDDDSAGHLHRCLGIEPHRGDNALRILDTSFLAHCYREQHGSATDLALPRPDLADCIRSSLSRYLKCLIDLEHNAIKKRSHIFDPCFNISLHGRCNVQHSRPFAHQLDQAWYNRRVRLHLIQIEVLHISHHIPHAEEFRERVTQQRQWLARLENALNPLLYINGSQSLLRAKDIPDAERGLSIVCQWSLDVLFYLDPTRPNLQNAFLGNFLNAAKLGLRLHAHSVVGHHLLSVPCATNDYRRRDFRAHPQLWSELPGKRPYTIPALAGFLRGEGDLNTGVAFMNLIVDRRLPLDFTTLCDFIDRLAGLYVMTRAHTTRGSLRDVLLPSSWIIELWPSFTRFQERNTANVDNLLRGLVRLLVNVYRGDVSVTDVRHRAHDLSPDAARDVCMSRICRDLYLVSHNVGDFASRNRVLASVTSLRTETAPGFIPLSRDYLFASDWRGLSKATMESCRRSIADEMILLKSRLTVAPLPLELMSYGVRQVVFNSTDEIPRLLQSSGALSDRFTSHRLSAAGGASQPRSASSRPITESERERAVLVLQKFCRTIRLRIPENLVDAARFRWTLQCRRHSRKMRKDDINMQSSGYLMMVKIHLPRLLFCLEWLLARAREERAAVKQRRIAAELENGDPEEHSVLLTRMENIRRIERGDVGQRLKELHQAAKQLQDIAQTLQNRSDISCPIQTDLDLALRGTRRASATSLLPPIISSSSSSSSPHRYALLSSASLARCHQVSPMAFSAPIACALLARQRRYRARGSPIL
ncbi:unnamed protein product [Peniophora sp. CBMAI 1063]|nr:unnamed protein product [Peniophora sp. CBMAI 1063]